MLKRFSAKALRAALDVLEKPTHVSEVETFLRALKPLAIEALKEELEDRPGIHAQDHAAPAPKSGR